MPILPLQAALDKYWAEGADGIPSLVDWLLKAAASKGASDLHLESREPDEQLILRWRLDGCLADAGIVKGPARVNLIQRIKVLAGLLTYRTDIPQDGRIDGKDIEGISDMRVSVYPTVQGEKAVVRFFQNRKKADGLNTDATPGTLDGLGLDHEDRIRLEEYLTRPQGMILLTGPAGSGKTTTLYAALGHINSFSGGQRQIVTIEDPTERILPGVTHTQIRPAVNLDYPNALKALLRQDPEVIMIGEIRDGETAQVAVQAALTGHLILSTVHAPSAPEVLLRLVHLGVEPYLIASVVSAVLDQRLLRRVCDVCKQKEHASSTAEPSNSGDQTSTPGAGVHCAVGCSTCSGTGYRGRILVSELLPIGGVLREAILKQNDRKALMHAAGHLGWRGLWVKGLALLEKGHTTSAELRRILTPV